MITLDASKYRVNVKPISLALKDKTPEERYNEIGPMALYTGVPIIVVCYYVGELYGFTDQLRAFIERLKSFYGVDEVIEVRI